MKMLSPHVWHTCHDLNCFIDWMDHWQTMLAGLGALAAGGLSVYYLRKQIAAAEYQEAQRRKRRLAAARARMQLALSDATNYANEALSLLKRCLDAIGRLGISADVTEVRPVLPEQALGAFEALIEATDDDDFAALIGNMISEMQVLNSRLSILPTERGSAGVLNIQAYIPNAAKVYGYASSIFEYARLETDQPPHQLSWDAVFSALTINELYDGRYPELHAFIVRARDRALLGPGSDVQH